MAISHKNGISVANISHFNGIVKANVSHLNGIATGFGGGGGNTITWQSWGDRGTAASGSITATYPASLASGDLIVLFVTMKPTTTGSGNSSVTTPSGFTSIGTIFGSSQGSTSGSDLGDVNIFAFCKQSNGTETGTLSVSTSGANSVLGVMHRLSKSGGTWSVAYATGEQSSGGNTDITATSDPGVTAGDYLLFCKCTSQNPLNLFTAGACTQSGVTFGTVTLHNDNVNATAGGMSSNFGNDVGGAIWGFPASSGTSAGNPQFTATNFTTLGIGVGMFVRIRLT
jgi:hypothetical protein